MSDDLVKRLRLPNLFAEPAETQRRELVMRSAADRIEKLEAALREIAGARPECCCISDAMQGIARKALEGKDER